MTTRGCGFAVALDGTSLWDLLQFECMRGGRRVLRISTPEAAGLVYFRSGNIVHAATAAVIGEAAVREMLAWKGGRAEAASAAWPQKESISVSFQSLLLRVAYAQDTGAAESDRVVVPFPVPEAAPGTARAKGEPQVTSPTDIPSRRSTGKTVLLSPTGAILRGADVHGLPEAAAYAVQMADLIGEFLGLDGFSALEASFDAAHFLIARTTDGNVVARREAQPSGLADLRQEVGL